MWKQTNKQTHPPKKNPTKPNQTKPRSTPQKIKKKKKETFLLLPQKFFPDPEKRCIYTARKWKRGQKGKEGGEKEIKNEKHQWIFICSGLVQGFNTYFYLVVFMNKRVNLLDMRLYLWKMCFNVTLEKVFIYLIFTHVVNNVSAYFSATKLFCTVDFLIPAFLTSSIKHGLLYKKKKNPMAFKISFSWPFLRVHPICSMV